MSQQRGTVTEHTIFSKELNEEIPVLVYLPPSFSPLSKYSLLITQDGKDYFQLGRIPRLADELLGKKEIENIIIAGIPYRNVQDRRRKYHPDGEQNAAFIRFLAHELVPFLDDAYPTYQMGMSRCLAGDSLGATVSLMAALQYPNIFGKIILYSPYVDEKVLKTVENNDQMHLLDIYHIIGQQETAVKMTNGQVKDFLSPNRELHLLMESKGLNPFYDEFDGHHSWKYWQPDLKRALRKMFAI